MGLVGACLNQMVYVHQAYPAKRLVNLKRTKMESLLIQLIHFGEESYIIVKYAMTHYN